MEENHLEMRNHKYITSQVKVLWVLDLWGWTSRLTYCLQISSSRGVGVVKLPKSIKIITKKNKKTKAKAATDRVTVIRYHGQHRLMEKSKWLQHRGSLQIHVLCGSQDSLPQPCQQPCHRVSPVCMHFYRHCLIDPVNSISMMQETNKDWSAVLFIE